MRLRIISLSIIICMITFNNVLAQFSDSTKYVGPKVEDTKLLKNNVNINPFYLIFGAIDIGFERRVLNQLSAEINFGFGKMWFTDIEKYYEVGLKYYMKKYSNNGLYLKSFINGIALKSDVKSADVTNYGAFLGYRWLISKKISIDLYGGFNFSSDDEVTFEEINGNVTKSINLGGIGQTGNLQIGISF